MNLPTNALGANVKLPSNLFRTMDFKLPGGFVFAPSYLQAGLIVLLLFLLILTLGSLRHRYNNWTMGGVMPGVTFGFLLAIFIEALLVAGGSTLFISVLGWKNAPKPISNVLDSGKTKLVDVLGESDQHPSSAIVISEYNKLDEAGKISVENMVCPQQ